MRASSYCLLRARGLSHYSQVSAIELAFHVKILPAGLRAAGHKADTITSLDFAALQTITRATLGKFPKPLQVPCDCLRLLFEVLIAAGGRGLRASAGLRRLATSLG